MVERSGLGARLQSFRYAFRGIGAMFRHEINARIHALATVAVALAGLAFEIDRWEWVAITLSVVLVIALEGVNTAIEALCDVVSPNPHPSIAQAKDVAAGAVLIAALGAVVVAIIVFGPRIASLFA